MVNTCASTRHVQAWTRDVQAGARHARTKGTRRQGHGTCKQRRDTRTQRALSTSGFVNVDCVTGLGCVNMHND